MIRVQTLAATVLLLLLSANAAAVVIHAEANWAGPVTPVTPACDPNTGLDVPGSVQSGDFTIENYGTNACPGGRGLDIGDGLNERTLWTLDFTTDVSYGLFDFSAPLVAATLVLDFIPRGLPHAGDPLSDFCGDSVFVKPTSGGARIDNASRPCSSFSFDQPAQVTIDLLTEYRLGSSSSGPFATDMSNRILTELVNKSGLLGMQYNDDSIVTRAQLTLVSSVSEPAALGLLLMGLAGVTAVRGRGRSG